MTSLEAIADERHAKHDKVGGPGTASDIVCLCLMDDSDVREVLDDRGLLGAFASGAVVGQGFGVERRRRWSRDEKARIVAETMAPGAVVCEVARRYGVSQSLIFYWRRQARAERLGEANASTLLPVEIAASTTCLTSNSVGDTGSLSSVLIGSTSSPLVIQSFQLHFAPIGTRTPRRFTSMLSVRGRIQREGDVVHLVVHHLADLSSELSSVGERETEFVLPHGRGDEFNNGAPGLDPRAHQMKRSAPRDISVPSCRVGPKRAAEPEATPSITPKVRDFR